MAPLSLHAVRQELESVYDLWAPQGESSGELYRNFIRQAWLVKSLVIGN